MNAPFVVAQANSTGSAGTAGTKPVRTIKVSKPQGEHAVTVELGYAQNYKLDLSGIANEKITLVHIGEKLIILFDNKSTVTVEPFFDSMNTPLSNVTVEATGRDFTSGEFASAFPITTDQSVLTAAGVAGFAGSPASGADFHGAAVDPLGVPNPLPLLGQEELPNWVVGPQPLAIAPAVTTTDVALKHDLSISKVVNIGEEQTNQANFAGQVIHYTINVTNTGEAPLTGVTVSDPRADAAPTLVGGDTNSNGQLDVGETWSYAATHTVTQSEINAGGIITNIAEATDSQGDDKTAQATTPINQHPDLLVVKSADVASVSSPSDDITYTITVTNNGNQTLTNVVVTDPMDPTSGHVVGTLASLAPGASQSLTFTYDVTQADIDNNGAVDGTADGIIHNTATVTDDQNITQHASTDVTVVQASDLAVTKTANVASVSSPSDDITYTITVTNNGNQTLTNVVVTDPMDPTSGHVVGTLASLAPGASQSLTFTYDVTQADIDNNGAVDGTADGIIHNTATVTDDQNITQHASTDVTVVQASDLAVTKTANVASVSGPSDDITYTITVTNNGNQTLTNVVVTDPMDPTSNHIVGTLASLAPGASQSLTFTYDVTQADIDNNGAVDGTADGIIHNTATVTDDQNITQHASTNVAVVQSPDLTITKTVASVTGGTADKAGDVIDYTITVHNTGNVDLTGVTVSDKVENNGATSANYVSGDTNSDGAINPGETWTFDAKYTLTQTDLDNKGGGDSKIDNTATVTDSQNVTKSASASESLFYGPTEIGAASLSVNEAALDTSKDGNDIAAGLVTGSLGSASSAETAQSTALTFAAGTDNIAGITFGSNFAGISVTGAAVGATFSWEIVSGTLIGHIGTLGGPIGIELTLSGTTTASAGGTASPTITATLTDNFLHAAGSGSISVTGIQVVAADTAGNTATGTVAITIADDVPTAGFTLSATTTVTADESAGLQANDQGGASPLATPAGAGTLMGWAQSSGSVIGSDTSKGGADGKASVAYAITTTGGGAFTGVDSGLSATATGNKIWLFTEGNLVVGREGSGAGGVTANAGGAVAFAIGLDTGNNLDVAQYEAIKHLNASDPNDSTSLTSGLLHITQTVTDGDGDKSTATNPAGLTVSFTDDGPTAPTVTASAATVVLDETPGIQSAPAKDIAGATAITFNGASSTVANLFSTVANKGVDADVATGSLDNGALSFAASGANMVTLTGGSFGVDGQAASGATTYALTVTNGSASGLTLTDGTAITLSTDGSGHVIGTVGNDAANPSLTGKVAFALTIDPQTGFAYTAQYLSLHNPDTTNPNDPVSLAANTVKVTATLKDGDGDTVTSAAGDISSHISFLDDGPSANAVQKSLVPNGHDTNIMLVLDVSGSMGDASGLTNLDRIDVLKAAVNELLEQYGDLGNVRVQIVEFSTGAAQVGTDWMTIAQAKAAVDSLTAGGNTNYDAALTTAEGMFSSSHPGALTTAGVQNVTYFMSDGEPNLPNGSVGVSATEETTWTTFLNTNHIDSFALGIGTGVTSSALDPVAFNGQTNTNTGSVIVTDLSQLTQTLVGTVTSTDGNLLSNGSVITGTFGADGGFVKSITVNGTTYTYDPTAGSVSVSGTTHGTYDPATHTETVTLTSGGVLAMHMDNGTFTYTAPANVSAGFTDTIPFLLSDNDGDTASNALTIVVSTQDHAPIVRDDNVITNVPTANGLDVISIPDYALLFNDSDPEGQAIAITAISNMVDGTVSHASGIVTFTELSNNDANGGSFTYTGTTTAPALSDTGDVTVDRSQAGESTLDGTGLGDILIGRDGSGSTIKGYEGNDVLVGGNSNDTLDGGTGNDLMAGGAGNDTYIVDSVGDQVIENANAGTDTVQASVSYTLPANVENLTLTGSDNINGTGNSLNNVITGNSGNNTLDGGAGTDTLIGGSGNDTYIVDSTTDTITENSNGGTDTVQSSVSFALGNNVENLTLTGSANIDATGNSLDNVIIGNSGNNTITGGTGKDTMTGNGGNDTFVFTGTGDSTNNSGTADIITDFVHGDFIDLTGIDANTSSSGNQAFNFSAGGVAAAHSVWVTESGGNTIVSMDTTGNTTADMVIVLTGIGKNLAAADFHL